jgi:hypothetical protein
MLGQSIRFVTINYGMKRKTSYLNGATKLLDIFGPLHFKRVRLGKSVDDGKRIGGDFRAIGEDFNTALSGEAPE